ncbi:Pam16-domain-containing protein [Coprinopsis sp. MPI-PUGE-AT-0042]|nr:Pam16-domain-containing protein [Coprinopsis sp. MPI-PUGE-AT-0042]
MASPRILVNILVSGSKALGKAFYEAGRQAAKNVKSSPAAIAGDAAGVSHANSGSPTDQLTRAHRMTLDEAALILNVKKDTPLEQVLKNYEHLFKANSPPAKPEKVIKAAPGKAGAPTYSHFLQSKVVRAKERWEAELKLGTQPAAAEAAEATAQTTPPPPPPPSSSSSSSAQPPPS